MKKHINKTEENLLGHYNEFVEYNATFESEEELEHVLKKIEVYPKPQETLLDLGCGDGGTSFFMENKYDLLCRGVDYSEGRITKALSKKKKKSKARFEQSSIQEFIKSHFKKQEKKYDYAFLFEVLEHLEFPEDVLSKCAKISKKIIGSIPIMHPSKAHIWDFESIEDGKSFLGADRYYHKGYYLFFVIEEKHLMN